MGVTETSSNKVTLGSADLDLDGVIIARERLVQTKFPDLMIRDKVVLKNGPKAYKVALHWALLDRHTGELHHHAVTIETYHKVKAGWTASVNQKVTLNDEDGDEITPLAIFLRTVRGDVVPEAAGKYIVINVADRRLASRVDGDVLNQLLDARPEAAPGLLNRLLSWAGSTANAVEAVSKLEALTPDNLNQLNTLIGISTLKKVLAIWDENRENDDEEFWQQVLTDNAVLFAQVFSFPVVVVQEKAFVGGKSISNRSGNIVDFLVKNGLTENAALIEIKKPTTPLLSKEYRKDVFNVSDELTGAVLQVSNYKNSLLRHFTSLTHPDSGPDLRIEAFDPRCLVVVGSLARDCTEAACRKSFELFRAALRDVQVVTFDELFAKVRILLDLLEGAPQQPASEGR